MSHKWQGILLLALAILLLAQVAGAQSGSGYDLRWNVVAGGGGRSAGSGWTATGTAGQAAPAVSGGSGFNLKSGFWQPVLRQVYLPMILKP